MSYAAKDELQDFGRLDLRQEDGLDVKSPEDLRPVEALVVELQDELRGREFTQAIRVVEELTVQILLLEADQNYPGGIVPSLVSALEREFDSGELSEFGRHKKVLTRMLGPWRTEKLVEHVVRRAS